MEQQQQQQQHAVPALQQLHQPVVAIAAAAAQQQQQHQTEDASSSGYGSPDSGGLIDEGWRWRLDDQVTSIINSIRFIYLNYLNVVFKNKKLVLFIIILNESERALLLLLHV